MNSSIYYYYADGIDGAYRYNQVILSAVSFSLCSNTI